MYKLDQQVWVDPVGDDEFLGVVVSCDEAEGTVTVRAAYEHPELDGIYPVEAVQPAG